MVRVILYTLNIQNNIIRMISDLQFVLLVLLGPTMCRELDQWADSLNALRG